MSFLETRNFNNNKTQVGWFVRNIVPLLLLFSFSNAKCYFLSQNRKQCLSTALNYKEFLKNSSTLVSSASKSSTKILSKLIVNQEKYNYLLEQCKLSKLMYSLTPNGIGICLKIASIEINIEHCQGESFNH